MKGDTKMKVLKVSYYVVSILFTAWMVASWLEIGFNNCDPNPVYNSMNLFMIMKGWGA